jgi:hypothetical protein
VQEDGSAVTVMLGLPGFVLLAVSHLGSEIEYAIETSEAVAGCPTCGVLARLHDRQRSDVRVKRIWRCMELGCGSRRRPSRVSRSGRGPR